MHRFPVDYDLLERQVVALLEDEQSFLANASNFAALVYTSLPQINWAGFYFPHPDALVLGPFGGKPACTRLPNGRGVCGKAFAGGEAIVVPDVAAFADHIVCDSASKSEMVIPLHKDGAIWGVFDIDAPVIARFTDEDVRGVERLVARFMEFTPVPAIYRTQRRPQTRINERLDIQTCHDHHVVLRYLADDMDAAADANRLQELFARFKSVLIAHLRLEDDYLYPRLMSSSNVMVKNKAARYRDEMGNLRAEFMELWRAWSPDGAIGSDIAAFRVAWTGFAAHLNARMQSEDLDLYPAWAADIS